MNKPWLAHYPEGVSHDINLEQFDSANDLLERSIQKFRHRDAFICMGAKITFQDLDYLSADFAAFLQNEVKLRKGDRVAIQMPNVLQYPVVLFAALRAGLVVVNTNPLYTPREMKHQFKDAGCKAIVILNTCSHFLEEIIAETDIESVVVTGVGDLLGFPKGLLVNTIVKYVKKMVPKYNLREAYTFHHALKLGSEARYTPVKCMRQDLAFLQYTGGTTGVSKGAELTHGNILANMLQIVEWIKPKLIEGQEVAVLALPLYHIFSLTVNGLGIVFYGGTNVMVTNPRDIPTFIKILKQYPFTVFPGLNTLYNALMNNAEFSNIDFTHLKISVAGGMALQASVAKRWTEITKTPVVEGYGLTETSPVASCNPIDGTDRIGTVGLPLPGTEMMLADDDGNEVKEIGASGEIWIRGPQVMRGYWQQPGETNNAMTPTGWLKSGDMGVMDKDGFFKIVDRKKDMIIVSGFNVYPNEIEDSVAHHPKVLEVAAIGVPDAKSSEAIKIFVVPKDPSLTRDELMAFCKENLTGYKVPKHIEFRESLPKSNVGKILRRELREN